MFFIHIFHVVDHVNNKLEVTTLSGDMDGKSKLMQQLPMQTMETVQ
jgi:hypothetical protein